MFVFHLTLLSAWDYSTGFQRRSRQLQGVFDQGVYRDFYLCAKTRFVSIAAIPHILFHMCRQIGFALRATTNRGGLPSGFAAGTARRRFDLKVELQAIRLPFDIPAPSTFVKRRRAIPTFGSRQAPRHEPGFARHEYPRTKTIPVNPMFVQPAKQTCSCAA